MPGCVAVTDSRAGISICGDPSRVVPRAYRLVPDQGMSRFFLSPGGDRGAEALKEDDMVEHGICVVCEGPVAVPAGVVTGEILRCADCGTELEVVNVDPLQLEEAPLVQEDWGE